MNKNENILNNSKVNIKEKFKNNIKIICILIIVSIILSLIGYYVFYKKIHANKINDKISKIQIEEEQEKLEKELSLQKNININNVLSEIKEKAKEKEKNKEEFKIIYVYEKETEKLPNKQIKETDVMINNLSLQLLGNKIPDFNTKIYIYTNEYKLSQNVYQTLKYAGYTNIWIINGFENIEKRNMDEIIENNKK